ncbi:MFS transporter [Blastococcus sp. SYSU D00820]
MPNHAPSRTPSRAGAFWSVTALLLLVLAASGVPSPLYRVYQERFDFTSGVLTTVFAVYAFALLASLLVVGALSDHLGRRPVLAAGLALQAGAMVLFLAADGVGWLMAARVVQGLSMGALTSTLGAALLDFQSSRRPLGALVNSASPGVGLSLGALGAGLAVEFVPAPTDWVFGALTAVLLVAAVAVLRLPETSPRLPGAAASLWPRVHVPPAQRAAFLVATPALLAMWALGGLYLSLGPSLADGVFGISDHLLGSLVIVAMQGAAAIGAVLARPLAPERAMVGGCLLFCVGVAGTLVAVALAGTVLFFVAAPVSGLGFGAAFLGAVATITAGTAPGQRGGIFAAIYVVGYLGFSVPAIIAGIAAGSVGLETATEVYAATVIALALVAVAGLARQRRVVRRAAAPAAEPAQPMAA